MLAGVYAGANYLIRLRQRMEKTGFAPTDELFEAVYQAQDAVQRLCVLDALRRLRERGWPAV